ncbi:polymerase [Chimaeribacter californicus]|uniref:Polymerase n=1 Tax=Chimaeribacter californicus TaxID=2060067 RepID=A0A2N5E090_9GAMM|nr:O-antigen ligase family protein [Chimaeribacter californicus]PLR33636.1 polymerase [Chimaeribacter californicus]
MPFLTERLSLERLWFAFFSLFLFFSAIFCGYTRVTNLFHLAAVSFLLLLWRRPLFRQQLTANRHLMTGLALAALYLVYYALSNLWTAHPLNIESTLTHSVYLLTFLAMLVTVLNSRYRPAIYLAICCGFAVLALFLMGVDHQNILTNRLMTLKSPGPDNVIDVGGYFAIGIILSLMVFRDTQRRVVLLLPLLLFIALLLTQSRGPAIALLLALVMTSHLGLFTRRNLLWCGAAVLVLGAFFAYSGLGEVMITRFEALAVQVYLRLSIWHHSFQLIGAAPFFGYGFDHQLSFTNYSGEYITTTHSLYLGALLKGGLVGFTTMLLLIGYGAKQALRCVREGRRLEASLFIFMLIFYVSQGMFNIGNPAEFWYLFWFPFAVVMTQNWPARALFPKG